jgi:hypothetical protein
MTVWVLEVDDAGVPDVVAAVQRQLHGPGGRGSSNLAGRSASTQQCRTRRRPSGVTMACLRRRISARSAGLP